LGYIPTSHKVPRKKKKKSTISSKLSRKKHKFNPQTAEKAESWQKQDSTSHYAEGKLSSVSGHNAGKTEKPSL
jgi:hypothetical protein